MANNDPTAQTSEAKRPSGGGFGALKYAAPLEGYRFLHESAALMPHMNWRHLTMRGADAIDYMHRRLAQSVKQLEVGTGTHALQLDGEGRMQADLLVYRTGEEELTVLTGRDQAEGVRQLIEKYVITEDVEVESHWVRGALVGVAGPKALEAIGEALEPGDLRLQMVEGAWVTVDDLDLGGATAAIFRDGRWSVPYYHVSVSQRELPQLVEALARGCEEVGGGPIDDVAFDYFRIEQGISRFGTDTDERTIPLDACLRDAIDLNKGCFPGQEFLARINNLGHPANELVRLQVTGEQMIPAGAKIVAKTPEEEVEAGRVTSARTLRGRDVTVALAYLKWKLRDFTTVTIQLPQNRFEAAVVPLPGRAEAQSA